MTSCCKWEYTSEGGVRLMNSKKFEYNKSKYATLERKIIDTNSVYKLISRQDWRGVWDDRPVPPCVLIRFFGSGQVLFFGCDKDSITDVVNNPYMGKPGYFIVKDKQIRIERWSITNGGQLEKYFGVIENDSTIKFYEQSVSYCFGSYNCLEKQNMFTVWKKQTNFKVKHYRPNW